LKIQPFAINDKGDNFTSLKNMKQIYKIKNNPTQSILLYQPIVRKIPDKSYDDVVKHDFTKNAIIYDLA
jgi:hypothetical protein